MSSHMFIPAEKWFSLVTGMEEHAWMADRGARVKELPPVEGDPRLGPHLAVAHAATDKLWDAGAFSVWGLGDLTAAAVSAASE
jgi:hypothetical protein